MKTIKIFAKVIGELFSYLIIFLFNLVSINTKQSPTVILKPIQSLPRLPVNCLISVVIPSFNEEKTITGVVQAARGDNNVEIILSDGGSTDSTVSLVQNMLNVCIVRGYIDTITCQKRQEILLHNPPLKI